MFVTIQPKVNKIKASYTKITHISSFREEMIYALVRKWFDCLLNMDKSANYIVEEFAYQRTKINY